MMCSNCKIARYCSKECQIQHWRDKHNAECRLFKTLPVVTATRAESSQGSVAVTKTLYRGIVDSKKHALNIGYITFHDRDDLDLMVTVVDGKTTDTGLAGGAFAYMYVDSNNVITEKMLTSVSPFNPNPATPQYIANCLGVTAEDIVSFYEGKTILLITIGKNSLKCIADVYTPSPEYLAGTAQSLDGMMIVGKTRKLTDR